jgi:hypothetical protein
MKSRDYIQRRVPADLSRIDVREQWQITFWTLELRTTQGASDPGCAGGGPGSRKHAGVAGEKPSPAHDALMMPEGHPVAFWGKG